MFPGCVVFTKTILTLLKLGIEPTKNKNFQIVPIPPTHNLQCKTKIRIISFLEDSAFDIIIGFKNLLQPLVIDKLGGYKYAADC